jgi:hypothetical protein
MIAMAARTPADSNPQDLANDWLSHHTLKDIRDLARELSSRGEDVTELVGAVNELEALLAETHVDNGEESDS